MIVITLAGQSLTLENKPFNNTGSEGRLYNIKGKPDYGKLKPVLFISPSGVRTSIRA